MLTSEMIIDADDQVAVKDIASVLEYLLVVILSLFLLKQIPSFGAAIAGSAAIGIDGLSKMADGMRGMYRGYNRAHGLRGDGRMNFAARNRREQRKKAGKAIKSVVQRSPHVEHPAKARADAERAAARKQAVDEGREAAMDKFIRNKGGRTV